MNSGRLTDTRLDAPGTRGDSRRRGIELSGDGAQAQARRAARSRTPQEDPTPPRRVPVAAVLAIAVLVAAIVAFASMCSTAMPITVTVNGTQHQLRGEKNMQVAIKESGLPVNPGDYISLKGNIIRRSAGYPFCAHVNGEETADPEFKLNNGDVIELTDGKDRVETYDAVESPVPYEASIVGTGAIHTFSDGVDGVLETRTGHESGEVVEKQTLDPVDVIETRHDPQVGDAKVIALTFDGGPTEAYTADILDILAQNDARATFFCVGTYVERNGAELVKKAAAQGCQICTHSYSDAEVTDGDFSLLSAEEQVEEIERGMQVLRDALGHEPSRKVRVGAQDMPLIAIPNIEPLIEAEIGWTLDTGDWIYVGRDEIYDVLTSAKPGDIVRMHDGGADCDETVAALEKALPKLKSQGFTFVTVDELMEISSGQQS